MAWQAPWIFSTSAISENRYQRTVAASMNSLLSPVRLGGSGRRCGLIRLVYSSTAMEEALYETTILRQFSGLSLERIPDETTILNFRRLLEKHELASGILAVINGYLGDRGLSLRQGTIVDATLINAPSSTKNKDGKRDPEMHQTKKGNQYYFGMKAHIGVDDESGLVHSVVGTAANVADVTQVDKLLHGDENMVGADAGYTGVEKRPVQSQAQDREGQGAGARQGRASG